MGIKNVMFNIANEQCLKAAFTSSVKDSNFVTKNAYVNWGGKKVIKVDGNIILFSQFVDYTLKQNDTSQRLLTSIQGVNTELKKQQSPITRFVQSKFQSLFYGSISKRIAESLQKKKFPYEKLSSEIVKKIKREMKPAKKKKLILLKSLRMFHDDKAFSNLPKIKAKYPEIQQQIHSDHDILDMCKYLTKKLTLLL
jgi:hypothetical protein